MMQHAETICDTFGGGLQFGSASRDAGHPGVNLLLPMLYIYDAWLHCKCHILQSLALAPFVGFPTQVIVFVRLGGNVLS